MKARARITLTLPRDHIRDLYAFAFRARRVIAANETRPSPAYKAVNMLCKAIEAALEHELRDSDG